MLKSKHANYDTFPRGSIYSEEGAHERRQKGWIGVRSWTNLLAFWLLGLSTDFGYWIILTGAHDLLSEVGSDRLITKSTSGRECNDWSTGVILVANIVPNFIIKMILPFFPLWINTRTFIAIVLSIAGFSLAASNQNQLYLLWGVTFCSLSVGIWTSSYLMYIPYFKDKMVVKAWCSGCGSSGFFASTVYVALTTARISLKTILSYVMIVPLIMALVFWFLLEHPEHEKEVTLIQDRSSDNITVIEKVKIIFKLIKSFTAPYFLVFFSEYLINQGLFELINFKNSPISLAIQVRWFIFVYLLAVLLASSFIGLKVDYLWLMALIQIINLSIFTSQSIYCWMGDSPFIFWAVILFIFWEGSVAGTSYANTYRRINDEMPNEYREFSMSFNSIGASMGMLLAGISAVPLHNFICDLPPP